MKAGLYPRHHAGSCRGVVSRLGPNRHLIGRDRETVVRELSTPAPMVDLDPFEANLATMTVKFHPASIRASAGFAPVGAVSFFA